MGLSFLLDFTLIAINMYKDLIRKSDYPAEGRHTAPARFTLETTETGCHTLTELFPVGKFSTELLGFRRIIGSVGTTL